MKIDKELKDFLYENQDGIKKDDWATVLRNAAWDGVDIQLCDLIRESNIDPIQFIKPKDWKAAEIFLNEDIFKSDKYLSEIFEDILYSPRYIRLPIPTEYFAEILYKYSNTDLALDALQDFLDGTIGDNWYSDVQYSINNVVQSLENNRLYPKVQQKLVELNILNGNGTVNIEELKNNESILKVIIQAIKDAVTNGSIENAEYDFEDAFQNAIQDWIEQADFGNGTVDCIISFDGIAKIAYWLYNDLPGDPDAWEDRLLDVLQSIISKNTATNFEFNEPSHGWNGFSIDTFNEALENNL